MSHATPDSDLPADLLAHLDAVDAGEVAAGDPWARLVASLRADLADRPSPDLLARLVALGAPETGAAAGLPWWRRLEAAIAELVGPGPVDLVGVRAGSAATHLAYEHDEVAVDLAIRGTADERCRIEGLVEDAGDLASTESASPSRVAVFAADDETPIAQTTLDASGRFEIAVPRDARRLVVEHHGRLLRLDLPEADDRTRA